MTQDKLFYVSQKAFIEKDGLVLILKSPKHPSKYLDFPGGKIKEGEISFEDSFKREVREETGLEISIGDPFFVWSHILPLEHKNSGEEVFLIGFRCKYVSGDLTTSSEHIGHEWVSKDDYKKVDDGSQFFKALEKYFSLSN